MVAQNTKRQSRNSQLHVNKADNNIPKPAESQERGIMAFPRIDTFYNLLMDRICMVLGRYFLKKPFTVLINALPRNHEEGEVIRAPRFANFSLIYAGIQRQKQLLGKPKSGTDLEKLENAWADLHNTRKAPMYYIDSQGKPVSISPETAAVGRNLYARLKRGELELSDIQQYGMGNLKDYFRPIYDPGSDIKPDIFQEAEEIVLSAYFDTTKYRYISVPLIQFAEFDGIVHVIYHEDEHDRFVDAAGDLRTEFVGDMIKAFSIEYEGIIFDWDIVAGNLYRTSVIQDLVDSARNPEFYNTLSTNPILNELEYREYYEKHEEYFKARIELSDEVPLTIREQYRRVAIMSILTDSYTHNISAHSLVALESWLKQRAIYLENKGKAMGLDFPDLPFVKNDQPFAYEMHEFVRFMLDKGAFWTGLNRDYNFGGKTNDLFSVIYNDFICNPLYLGTIAYSEGVTRLNVNITFLKKEKDLGGEILWRKEVLADGILASIDLKHWNPAHARQTADQDYESGFIIRGEQFEALKGRLQHCKIYFPGGVVGIHAFLTILENEIRNIKHYLEKALNEMKANGLTLNLSIEEGHYENTNNKPNSQPEYYYIGIWLKHEQTVSETDFVDRVTNLYGDIINKDKNPRLGGIYQDKICAAFLFNNSFSSVQVAEKNASERDKRFYPWVKVGFSKDLDFTKGDYIEEFELSARRYFQKEMEESKRFFEDNFGNFTGHYKKFINVWRGEDIFEYNRTEKGDIEKSWENLSRFRFVQLTDIADKKQWQDDFRMLRKNGIIRVINQSAKTIGEAYCQWFRKWLKSEEGKAGHASLLFKIKDQEMAEVLWNGKKTEYRGSKNAESTENPAGRTVLMLAHGKNTEPVSADESRFRSHGILLQYFTNGASLDTAQIGEDVAAELLETMLTKICIFDKRIEKWFAKMSEKKMQSLGCEVYDESQRRWKEIKANGFFRYHFLVVHLSFIEALTDERGVKYSEDRMDKFVENEILQGQEPPENFIFVIASGRGRKQWQITLENNTARPKDFYSSFVMFRPLESLHSAVENTQTKSDDIETKYMLTKILLGS